MLLNSRRGLIDVMIESGIISILGEVVVNETDALALVFFLFFPFLSYCYFALTTASGYYGIIPTCSAFRIE